MKVKSKKRIRKNRRTEKSPKVAVQSREREIAQFLLNTLVQEELTVTSIYQPFLEYFGADQCFAPEDPGNHRYYRNALRRVLHFRYQHLFQPIDDPETKIRRWTLSEAGRKAAEQLLHGHDKPLIACFFQQFHQEAIDRQTFATLILLASEIAARDFERITDHDLLDAFNALGESQRTPNLDQLYLDVDRERRRRKLPCS